MIDLTIGNLYATMRGEKKPKLHYSNGGYWIENSVFGREYCKLVKCLGVTIGPFAFTPEGASLDTILHEKGHIKQYNRRGGWGMLKDGLYRRDRLERENDYAEFTFGYDRLYEYLVIGGIIDGKRIEEINVFDVGKYTRIQREVWERFLYLTLSLEEYIFIKLNDLDKDYNLGIILSE